MSQRALLEMAIRGREAALAKADGKRAHEISAELEALRKRLAALPAEPPKAEGAE